MICVCECVVTVSLYILPLPFPGTRLFLSAYSYFDRRYSVQHVVLIRIWGRTNHTVYIEWLCKTGELLCYVRPHEKLSILTRARAARQFWAPGGVTITEPHRTSQGRLLSGNVFPYLKVKDECKAWRSWDTYPAWIIVTWFSPPIVQGFLRLHVTRMWTECKSIYRLTFEPCQSGMLGRRGTGDAINPPLPIFAWARRIFPSVA